MEALHGADPQDATASLLQRLSGAAGLLPAAELAPLRRVVQKTRAGVFNSGAARAACLACEVIA